MCGGMNYCPPSRPVFVHVVRPVADEMPKLPLYSGEEIECAFPELFEFLTVMMFLDPRGYTGNLDDEQNSSPGSWYGLSWGCIHRDTLYHWRPYARNVRLDFWKRCWRWIVTFGKEPIIDPGYGRDVFLAFFDALPIRCFKRAVLRLVRRGYLEKQIEEYQGNGQEIEVLYPTPALAERLAQARLSCSS